ncbi:T9SS type A sorting domain-containing protein [uncultured Dokdonia sp.]|uniref:T9SS type A sorting domain-containing protein n=1 Tax=uncultured Dokdonia sp. TaxID=575653 RepID=UPI002624093C|nr:T9SS type A sorting domain-containing protein [uncultured Dokdonia sp.]
MNKQLLFIVSIFFMISQGIFAQDPLLFEGIWKLESLVIDGEEFFPPFNDEVHTVGLTFEDEEGADVFNSWVCNSFFASINFEEGGNESDFSFSFTEDYAITLLECDLAENTTFENQYFNFYLNTIQDPFGYYIEIPEETVTLVVIASNGDIAVYTNDSLSLSENTLLSFSIYPNPVQDRLFIQTENSLEDFTVTVFDMLGRTLITTSKEALETSPIDVQDWKSGIYFLRMEDQNGGAITKRFIKN